MNSEAIETLIIAGGGTAGWMAAASLAKHFQNTPLKIILIESSAIGTIGVGEATIPTIRRFYRQLGLSDGEVIQATLATCKLGIAFDDWKTEGHSFIHPFGRFGQDFNQIPFHHYWLKLHQRGKAENIGNFSLPVKLARSGKFTLPAVKPSNSLGVFDWALHLDATAFAQLLKKKALEMGVTAIDARIVKTLRNPNTGFIQSLQLDNEQEISGDLFIDCTGFKGLLIQESLGVEFDSWQDQLLCDRAVVVQTELSTPKAPPSYTQAKAHSAGWQWKIPLQTRQGNGHVFASRYISDDQATQTLLDHAGAKPIQDPRIIHFTPGRRKLAWHKNCICLGLSAGFLEPLESTSIALIETGIEKIKLLFPTKACDPILADEFNEMTRLEYERVRDFIQLHYSLNQRHGEFFWDDCRHLKTPETLTKKMALFKARGHLLKYRWEIFQNPSWVALYTGFGFLPSHYDPAADKIDDDQLIAMFNSMEQGLKQAVDQTPSHIEFLGYLNEANPT